MSTADYGSLYNDYWGRQDRWGSHSFSDAGALADRILAVCGGGRLLDVGCGMGLLVRTLLLRGVDAQGVDVSSLAVEELNRRAPNRFHRSSVLALPFEAEAFETVVCTDMLEHLAEPDVPTALRELHRVTRRFAFLTVATTPDRDGSWHLTVKDRNWWEQQLFATGFRKHPLYQTICPYETLEDDPAQITLVLEKIPPAAFARYSPASLQEHRLLHMDMLRDAGRRSDAHVARYTLALPYVRAGDEVLDIACGLGYGSAILAAGSPARRVVGMDNSPYAIDYARLHYASTSPGLEFQLQDAADLSSLADASFDFVVSMETLEHLEDPERFLADLQRILRPGGRVALSVPNEWVDETGQDPNPHHLHVYTWEKLRAQVTAKFLFERAFAQIAGGAMKLPTGRRSLREVPIQATQTADAEWWIALAMRDPLCGPPVPYRETEFEDYHDIPGAHLTAFGRDYDNAWLVRSMIGIGRRCVNDVELEAIARRVAAEARRGSADQGAALCILAYRWLERKEPPADEARHLLATLAEYEKTADHTPHATRWRISNRYVAARMLLAIGEREAGRDAFLACAELDPLEFSPLLATKTVDALFQAGILFACDRRRADAAACWQRGLSEARRVLQGDWAGIWGRIDFPASFGLPEVTQLADLATRCSYGLLCLNHWEDRPGWTWTRTFSNLAAQIETARREVRELRPYAASLEHALRAETTYAQERTAAIDWLKNVVAERERQLRELTASLAERDQTLAAAQEREREWAGRVEQLTSRLGDSEKSAADLRSRLQAAERGFATRVARFFRSRHGYSE